MNNVDSINEIQKTIDARDIIFWYSGYITEEALQGIGGTIKKKLGLVHVDRKVARSVFAIFVESVQNVIRYSQAVLRDEGGDDGMLEAGEDVAEELEHAHPDPRGDAPP